jgi:hypothetical protein
MKTSWILLSMFISLSAFASGGIEGGNGGDICEDRFKVVRDDIASWISNGGSTGLTLPGDISISQYNGKMLSEIKGAQLSCVDQEITVDGAEKTCKNFVDTQNVPQIVCNAERFMATSEADQYVLVHHEYAGLSGFEINKGKDSQYSISNQITGYLADQVVKKLVIRGENNFLTGPVLNGSYGCFDSVHLGAQGNCWITKLAISDGSSPGLKTISGSFDADDSGSGESITFSLNGKPSSGGLSANGVVSVDYGDGTSCSFSVDITLARLKNGLLKVRGTIPRSISDQLKGRCQPAASRTLDDQPLFGLNPVGIAWNDDRNVLALTDHSVTITNIIPGVWFARGMHNTAANPGTPVQPPIVGIPSGWKVEIDCSVGNSGSGVYYSDQILPSQLRYIDTEDGNGYYDYFSTDPSYVKTPVAQLHLSSREQCLAMIKIYSTGGENYMGSAQELGFDEYGNVLFY